MRRKRLLFLVALLVIGFATVSTTLVLNGVTLIGSNEQDFQIYFSEAILDDADKSNSIIKDNKQIIDFETNELTLVGDISTLDYEVTNNSRQYDAEVEINCAAKSPEIFDYVDLEYSIEKEIIPAKERARGKVKATLKKPYTGDEEFDKTLACSIGTNALEKSDANDIVLEEREHYAYGYLTKGGDSLPNRVVAVIANGETKMSTTDIRGMFIIEGLIGGDYELLVIEGKTEEELSALTHEELKTLASDSSAFNTADGKLTLTNYELVNSKINPGSPTTHTVTFDTTGGTTVTFTGTLIEGEPIGHLPKEVEHETLAFVDWQENGTTVPEDKVYNGDITLNANYGEGVAKIGEKQFRTLNNAFNYINTTDETTIDVIKANSIQKDITTDKNVILNLNEFKVDFNTHKLTNSGALTIKNGIVDASGINTLTNNGTLSLNNNFTLNYLNNTNETEVINTIVNNEGSTLNLDNTTLNTNITNYVENQALIHSYGELNIDNSNIDSSNAIINTETGSTSNINNSTFDFEHSFVERHLNFIKCAGVLNYENSTMTMKETNTLGDGLISIEENGHGNIKNGIFDNTYGKGNCIRNAENAILNIGDKDKNIEVIGTGTNMYSFFFGGDAYINDGTINTSNGPGYGTGNQSKITIGSSTAVPTFNHESSESMFIIGSNQDNRIINANINSTDGEPIKIMSDANLTIDDANIVYKSAIQYQRIIMNNGSLTINGGNYNYTEENTGGSGLIQANSPGTITINGGYFDNTYGKGNSIYTREGTTLTIGGEDAPTTFIGKGGNIATIVAKGDLIIPTGTINISNGAGISVDGKMTVGSETTTPTINGNIEKQVIFGVSSNADNRIINANINSNNAWSIYTYENTKLTIDNVNITQTSTNNTSGSIHVEGELTINDGNFKINEDNDKSNGSGGLMDILKGGSVTINGGTFDNTYGNVNSIDASAGSTLNIGAEGKMVNFIGNNSTSYTVTSSGNIDILNGNISFTNGHGMEVNGLLTIGSETATPTITGRMPQKQLLSISSNSENTIKNANFNILDSTGIVINKTGKLTIDNADIDFANTVTNNRMFYVSGALIINDGTYAVSSSNTTGNGIIQINATGTATFNGGNFEGSFAKSNAITGVSGSTLNIGAEGKTVNIIGNDSTSYTMSIAGNLNILAGTINFSKGYGLSVTGLLTIGSETSTPTIVGNTGKKTILTIKSSNENIIKNANITVNDARAINIHENMKLTIDNVNLEQTNPTVTYKALQVNGELIVNGGSYALGDTNTKGYGLLEILSTGKATINGGSFDNTYGQGNCISAESGSTLNINGDTKMRTNPVETQPRLINMQGNLIINNVDIMTSGKSSGVLSVGSNSKTTINGGTIICASNGNTILVSRNAVLDLGKEATNNLSILYTGTVYYTSIVNYGELNIYSGNYRSDTGDVVSQSMFDFKNATAEERLNYAGTTNIYGGHLENNSGISTVVVSAGKLNMSGGEIINNGVGRTINNDGGTAIQTGGTSANNYGVTVK